MIQDKTTLFSLIEPENPIKRGGKPSDREDSVWADTRARPEIRSITVATKRVLKGTA
jgi:hypothetical protein